MDRVQKYMYRATIEAEIRKAEVVDEPWKDKDGKVHENSYILIKALDREDNSFFIKDKHLENLVNYQRGTEGKFDIRIDVDEGFKGKTTITLVGFQKDEDK